MIIRKEQMQVFSDHVTEVFDKKTIAFLRTNFKEWAEGKDDAALKSYIHSMVSLGKKYKILQQLNVQKLMHYHIQYKFDIPLHRNLEAILTEYKYKEGNRVHHLRDFLKSGVTI